MEGLFLGAEPASLFRLLLSVNNHGYIYEEESRRRETPGPSVIVKRIAGRAVRVAVCWCSPANIRFSHLWSVLLELAAQVDEFLPGLFALVLSVGKLRGGDV